MVRWHLFFGRAPGERRYRLDFLRLRELLRLRVERPRVLLARLRVPPERPRLRELRLALERLRLLLFRAPADFRRRVEAALRADAEREDFEREAAARPPFLPPLRDELLLVFFPRPEPLFLPPPVSLFTVAQARRSASPRETPRFSYPSSICSAWRFCLLVYEDLSPRGIIEASSLSEPGCPCIGRGAK
jgi:hypothetical protein